MKCEKCGSGNTIEGSLGTNMVGAFFSKEKVTTKGISGKYPQISAHGCKDCGHIFDLKMFNNKFFK